MPNTSPFLITSEVAGRLRCSVRTIHELTRLGLIPTDVFPDLDDVSSALTNLRRGGPGIGCSAQVGAGSSLSRGCPAPTEPSEVVGVALRPPPIQGETAAVTA